MAPDTQTVAIPCGQRADRVIPIVVAALLLVWLVAGCAYVAPPSVVPAAERAMVVDAFRASLLRQGECPSAIDAAATVSVRSLVGSGALSGYLQVLSPSLLKFVGLNPLGQPILVLVSDGRWFSSLVVPEGKAYKGPVASNFFSRYVSSALASDMSFYRLIGRVVPGHLQVTAVTRDREGGYWLDVSQNGGSARSRYLFDSDRQVNRRQIVLDADGEPEAELFYDDFRAGPCPLPQQITITTSQRNGTFKMQLSDWVDDPGLVAADFALSVPVGFEKVTIK